MSSHAIKHIVIAGGGTAGWMSAATLCQFLGQQVKITLIESSQIGTVGVGEATIPTMLTFHRFIGIDEAEFMAHTDATFKLSIHFENWLNDNVDYHHPFGELGQNTWAAGFQHYWLKGLDLGVNYPLSDYGVEFQATLQGKFFNNDELDTARAYHLDAGLYAKYLRTLCENKGVQRIDAIINQVTTSSDTGFIESLTLDNGDIINADFFIDCTGFKGTLIEETLHSGYEDWSHWLLCNRAWAVQSTPLERSQTFTRSIAHEAGWRWQIPLQTRTGNGNVFSSRYLSDDEALNMLMANIEGEAINEPKLVQFKPGVRRKPWLKNCLAIGLSSGFIEPLESTSIHLVQRAILKFIVLFPTFDINSTDADEYNRQIHQEMTNIRDFIIMHYHLNMKEDQPFWQYCANMDIPASLEHRLNLFFKSGRAFREQDELFSEGSWYQVMMGQGMHPEGYHPFVDNTPNNELVQFLEKTRSNVMETVASWPDARQFISQYCPTKK